jgi:hypothetical protein
MANVTVTEEFMELAASNASLLAQLKSVLRMVADPVCLPVKDSQDRTVIRLNKKETEILMATVRNHCGK